MKESIKPSNNPESIETKEREARKQLGKIAIESNSPSYDEVFSMSDEEFEELYDAHIKLVGSMKRKIRRIDREDERSLIDSLAIQKKQREKNNGDYLSHVDDTTLDRSKLYRRKEELDFFFEEYEYPKKWFHIREQLFPAIATPEQNPKNIDKHTKSLVNTLAGVIINLDVPEEKIKRMSGILTSKHLPDFAKQMSIFQLISPIDEMDLDYHTDNLFHRRERTTVSIKGGKLESPVLKCLAKDQAENRRNGELVESKIKAENGREYTAEEVIYHDILKCAFGSNGKNIESFLSTLEEGDTFTGQLRELESSSRMQDCFSVTQVQKAVDYIETLNSLYYSQMQAGRKQSEFTDNDLPSIDEIMNGSVADFDRQVRKTEELFGVTSRHSLSDRVVRSFCHPLGINSIQSAYEYIQKAHDAAITRNSHSVQNGEISKPQDELLLKGVDDVEYLPNILEDGILAKEYLGVGVCGDMTALDADFCTVSNGKTSLPDIIESSIALGFSGSRERSGFIIAIKNNQRFKDEYNRENQEIIYDRDKYGIFAADDYFEVPYSKPVSIRTGVASSEIDFIAAYEQTADRIIEYINKNDFYIPVVDFEGNLLLSPEEWEKSHHE